MTTEAKDHTVQGLLKNDKELRENKGFEALLDKYSKPASDDSVAKAVKALTDKGHKATVVSSKEDAVKFLEGLIPENATVFTGHSETLHQIGFMDTLKNSKKWKNLKAEHIAATTKGDWAAAGAVFAKAVSADYWLASVGAVSETGSIIWGSLTGTRVASTGPKNLVFVVGTNKIVPDFAAAQKRLEEYQLTLESARVRDVYKVPASMLAEVGAIHAANPYAKGAVHVVFVKGSWGY